jgi:hypothetical protein
VTRPLIVLPAARLEIIEAQGWYEKKRSVSARSFGLKLTDGPCGSLPIRCNFR